MTHVGHVLSATSLEVSIPLVGDEDPGIPDSGLTFCNALTPERYGLYSLPTQIKQ